MEVRASSEGFLLNKILVLPTKGKTELLGELHTYKYVKRILDVVISSLALIVLSPLFLIIAVLIKLESKGPVFFGHRRIGKDGKEIKILKFRTMVDNAEDLIKKFTPEQMEEFKKNFKSTLLHYTFKIIIINFSIFVNISFIY